MRLFLLTFKWCRIAVLLCIFVFIVLGLFLNHVGLPEWVESRLRQQIEDQGWEVSYSRLRLRWYHGIVAENLQLQRAKAAAGPHLFLHRAEFRPNWRALLEWRLQSEGVALEDGRLIWPLPGTNQPQRTFVLNQLSGELLFKPNDEWELKHLTAQCLGAFVRFRGDITNASLLQSWRIRPAARPGAPPGAAAHRLLNELEQIRFAGPPTAQVVFSGDARDWRGFDVSVRLSAPGMLSPWGSGTNVTAIVRTVPPTTVRDPIRLGLQIRAEDSRTRWADAGRLELNLQLEPSLERLLPTNATLFAELNDARADWGRAARLSLEARCQPEGEGAVEQSTFLNVDGAQLNTRWGSATRLVAGILARHNPTNYLPAGVDLTFHGDDLRTAWVTSQWARVEGRFELPPAGQFGLFASNRLWLDRITNLPFHVSAQFSNALTAGLIVDHAATTIDWREPHGRVSAQVTSGEAAAQVAFTAHAATREITFTNAAILRPESLAAYLSTNAQRWLAGFASATPPNIVNSGRFTLPSWERWPTNWQTEVLSTVEMRGRLESSSAVYRRVAVNRTSVPFALTNLVWELTDLQLDRPEGGFRANVRASEATGDFDVTLRSEVNPLALRPAFADVPDANDVFDLFQLPGPPPRLKARLTGNRRDLATLRGTADVQVTNVVFRGVPIPGVTAHLTYSNQWLSILEPVVVREGERGTADGIAIDLAGARLFLTNATGRLSPLAIGQAIGPITRQAIEPYVFDVPPDARAEGSVPLARWNRNTEDLRFVIDGERFHWKVLNFERLQGSVRWQGNLLTLTNVMAAWYGGTLTGWAQFDFDAPNGGRMAFDAHFANCALKPIVRDFQNGRTNNLDGTISGRMRVVRADINRLNSWDGDGRIELKEGLIWDIPLFGLLSPILNGLVPGLGNSRAKEGRATFTMTNSVIYSKDLQIIANATPLRYEGQVDFDGNVTARVEAELMREIPGIGRVISTVFWPVTRLLLRYSVTGTLADPKLKPVNPIAEILTLPFRPLRAINEMLTPDKKGADQDK